MIVDSSPSAISDRSIRRRDSDHTASRAVPAGLSDRDVWVVRHFGKLKSVEHVAPVDPIHQRLEALVHRDIGWDSYGGQPLDQAVANEVERFLRDLGSQAVRLPSIVPTSLGGVALEWHSQEREFTIELRPNDSRTGADAYVFYSGGAPGDEWEAAISDLDSEEVNRAFYEVVGPR